MSPTPLSVLSEKLRECRGISIDSRSIGPGELFWALNGARVNGNAYAAAALEAGARFAVVDDERYLVAGDERYLLVENGLDTLQRLATYRRDRFRMPVLAITGSNGKTTTKELVAAVLARQYRVHFTHGNYNNHIGLPLTILSAPADCEIMVLEMGANHQREIAELCAIAKPTHGLVTNVGDAHLEGFGGREGVVKGKKELYEYLASNGGVAFFNKDEERLEEMAGTVARKVPFADSESPSPLVPAMEVQALTVSPRVSVAFLDGGSLVTARTRLSGRHNLQNVKAAIAVGKYFKVRGSEIARALEDYLPSNHRSQWMEQRGLNFYFDAYNANPTSIEAALDAFAAVSTPNESVVILGEMLELGEAAATAHLRAALRGGQVARTVLLVGELMSPAAAEFDRPYFKDVGALKEWFWEQNWEGLKIFVKGSRGNKLERLLSAD